MNHTFDVAVVGAGICGLAHAWIAARQGKRVVVFERDPQADGASIRNFGMIWPIGQAAGAAHELAMASRSLWCTLASEAKFWLDECGSIHLAHREDEWDVLQEFGEQAATTGYDCRLLTRDDVLQRSRAVNPEHLLGGLWSPTELCVDPREVLRCVPEFLRDQLHVDVRFSTPVRAVDGTTIETADGVHWSADEVIVATGSDFKTLFPNAFASAGLRRCKLQMMRTVPQPNELGPHLASGLTLRHYANFASCASLARVKQRIATETPELDRFGIHVMASQNSQGEVVLGDSHEYGDAITPFGKVEVDELILRELRKIIRLDSWTIGERWYGVYAKHPDDICYEQTIRDGVKIVTGLGGAGMTLSFGIAARSTRWPA